MDITKSTRHQKIIGDFGEMVICNWLSRSGFEVSVVDHTGIDIIAYNPKTKQRFGITVKSRTRNVGTERASVTVLTNREGKDDRKKLLNACAAFACEAWIAVYVETASWADAYLTSLSHYDSKYRSKEGLGRDNWKMAPKHQKQYDLDPNVKHIHITFKAIQWW